MNESRWKGTRRTEFERPNQHPVVNHLIDDMEIGTTVHGEPVKVDQTGTSRLAGDLTNAAPLSQPALSEADFIRQMQTDADMADQQPRPQISDPWDNPVYVETNRTIPDPHPPVNATPIPEQVYVGTNADVGGGVLPQAVAADFRVDDRTGMPIQSGQVTPQSALAGLKAGWDYSVDKGGFSRSILWNRAPKELYQDMSGTAKLGFGVGRLAGDVLGEGSRSALWRIQPEDVVGTKGGELLTELGANRTTQILGAKLANAVMSAASGNWNPLNPAEGFRPTGYAATDPNPDDPTQSGNLAMEAINRGILGRTGRLLPWEQFHQERPDVSYDKYANYQNYLKDSGPLFGVVKGTLDGVDGPEARIAGYRVTPLGALAPAAVIGGTILALKKGWIPEKT